MKDSEALKVVMDLALKGSVQEHIAQFVAPHLLSRFHKEQEAFAKIKSMMKNAKKGERMKKITEKELVDAISEGLEGKFTKSDIKSVLQQAAATIVEQASAGNEVAFMGLGKFRPVTTAERPGRNPKTGEPITVAARTSLRFKSTTVLAKG